MDRATLNFVCREHVAETAVGVEFHVNRYRDGSFRAYAWDMRGLSEDEVPSAARHVLVSESVSTLEDACAACEAALPLILAAPYGGEARDLAAREADQAQDQAGRASNRAGPVGSSDEGRNGKLEVVEPATDAYHAHVAACVTCSARTDVFDLCPAGHGLAASMLESE